MKLVLLGGVDVEHVPLHHVVAPRCSRLEDDVPVVVLLVPRQRERVAPDSALPGLALLPREPEGAVLAHVAWSSE